MRFVFTLWLAIFASHQANAQSYCEALLQPSVASSFSNLSTDLALLSIVNANNFEEYKRNSSSAGSFEDMFSASSDYSSFSQRRQELFKLYNFNYSTSQLRSFYTKTLDEGLAAAYNNCMSRHGLKSRIIRAGNDNVTVELEWTAFPGKIEPVSLSFQPIIGAIAASTLPDTLNVNSTVQISFNRIEDKDFELIANAGDTSTSVFAPRFINEVIIPEMTLGACRGHGGVEGVQSWGPVGEPCWGIKEWGKYGDDEVRTFTELAYCLGKGNVVDNMHLWGPKGEDCAGMGGAWGHYNIDSKTIDSFTLGSCIGSGGVSGLKTYAPVGKACYGIRTWTPYQ